MIIFKRLETIVGTTVTLWLCFVQNLDREFLVDGVVFGEEDVEGAGVVGGGGRCAAFEGGYEGVAEIDREAGRGHVAGYAVLQCGLEAHGYRRRDQHYRNVLEPLHTSQLLRRVAVVHDDAVVHVCRPDLGRMAF